MFPYQTGEALPGWYVSDKGPLKRHGPNPKAEPWDGAMLTRIGGPFSTKEEAASFAASLIAETPNFRGHEYIWFHPGKTGLAIRRHVRMVQPERTEPLPSDPRLEVLESFPELKGLGQEQLQEFCDLWRATPLAREFAVSALRVESSSNRLLLAFSCELNHKLKPGDEYFFPIDELLVYLAEQGIVDKATRDALKCKIANARRAAGPDAYRRFLLPSKPKSPLWVTCKNSACGNVMITDMEALPGARIRFDPEEIRCPKCGQSFMTDGTDFHFGPKD